MALLPDRVLRAQDGTDVLVFLACPGEPFLHDRGVGQHLYLKAARPDDERFYGVYDIDQLDPAAEHDSPWPIFVEQREDGTLEMCGFGGLGVDEEPVVIAAGEVFALVAWARRALGLTTVLDGPRGRLAGVAQ